MFKRPFVVLDLETSGVDPSRDEIIEVGMVRYENGVEVGRYESLIKIDEPLSKVITLITGITDEDLEKEGKSKQEVYSKITEFLEGAFLVAHNTKFDVGFLKAKKIKLGILGEIDTVPLSQICFPELPSYSLESLSDDLGLKHENKHRALSDVEATLGLFEKIYERLEGLPLSIVQEMKQLVDRSTWDPSTIFLDLKGNKSASTKVSPVTNPMIDISLAKKKPLSSEEILSEGGVLEQFWEDYEPREQQEKMSKEISSAFDGKYHLICEAPTGVGKSLAYLIPSAYQAITKKSKVVISTNTINLQQQLYEKDVPLLQKIYQESTGSKGVKVALLKGRRHYLCLRRLALFKDRPHFTNEQIILLMKILYWQATTVTDDCSEIHLSREDYLIWDFELCSDQKHCTPQNCKTFGDCYLHRARKQADAADIIIVNHALLCADLEYEGGLLPDYDYLVVDEAHNFEASCTDAFGKRLKQENFNVPLRSIKNQLELMKRQYVNTLFSSPELSDQIEHLLGQIPEVDLAIDNLFTVVAYFIGRHVNESTYKENLLIDAVLMGSEEWMNLSISSKEASDEVLRFLRKVKKMIDLVQVGSGQPDESLLIDELFQECEGLQDQFIVLSRFFSEEIKTDSIRWMSVNQSGVVELNLAPYVPGDVLKKNLYNKKKSIVFTSATLGVKLKQEGFDEAEQHPFTYFRTILGLGPEFEELIIDSPFDYEAQSYVLVPSDAEPIASPKSTKQLVGFFEELIKRVKGGMLSLFTSYRIIEQLYLDLMEPLKNDGVYLLAQRLSGGRNKILKAYLNRPDQSVLFGTSSFWEGVDIRGEALTALVIHKLPFDVPTDPICKARSELFQNGFMQYSVPRAILRFRQGFGRLIRSKKDYGVMVVLDNRVLTKKYGKWFLDALPDNITLEKIPLGEIPEKAEEWLKFSKSA